MRISLFPLLAALALAVFPGLPLHAGDGPQVSVTASEKTPPAKAGKAKQGLKADEKGAVSETRIKRMRSRWRKMTPEQRAEMRQKAARRLKERFERLSPQEQNQITGIMAQVEKMNREQRSILLAKINQKAYKERQRKRLMKEQAVKGITAPTAPKAPKAEAPTPPVSDKKAPE